MTVTDLFLPLSHTSAFAQRSAANDAIYHCPQKTESTGAVPSIGCNQHVRLLRHAKEQDRTRFALAGKLSDVCAALDELAAQEQRNTWRYAGV